MLLSAKTSLILKKSGYKTDIFIAYNTSCIKMILTL